MIGLSKVRTNSFCQAVFKKQGEIVAIINIVAGWAKKEDEIYFLSEQGLNASLCESIDNVSVSGALELLKNAASGRYDFCKERTTTGAWTHFYEAE